MSPLTIFINFLKRGDGAEQAKKALEDVQQATADANQEQRSFVDVSAAGQKVLAAFGARTGPLSRGLLMLSRNFRILGESIGIAITGGFKKFLDIALGAATLITSLWAAFSNRGSAMSDAATEADAVADATSDMSTATDEAGNKLDDFGTAAQTAADREKEFSDALKRSEAASKSYITALEDLEEAHKKNAIANLDLLQSQGKISEFDYDVQRSRIETGSAIAALEREGKSIDDEIAVKGREWRAMESRFTSTSTEAKRRNETYQASGGDAGLDDSRASAAASQEALKAAKDDFQRQSRTYLSGGITPELYEASVQRKHAAEAAAEEAAARVSQLEALQSQAQESNRAAAEARERFLSQSPTIEKEIEGLKTRRQSVDVNISSEKNIGQARENNARKREDRRIEAENERLKKEQEDGMAAWIKHRADQEKNLPPEERLQRVIADVQPVAQRPEGSYGGEVGRATQAQARDAIQQAGERIQAGDDDAVVLDRLVGTLQRLGAVMGRFNLDGLVQQLDMLDGKIDVLESQQKNGRD